MTQDTGGNAPGSQAGYDPDPTYGTESTYGTGSTFGTESTYGSQSTTEVAKDEARGVGESVKEAGGHVAQTAADQAKEVAAQTRQQARDLMSEGRQQVREQARTGQHRAAEGLNALADELREMADRGDRSGVATEVARQAADRVQDCGAWLRMREPGDLLVEFRSWARQRPGTFLLGAALAGVVAGRLTSGAIAAQRDSDRTGQVPPQATGQELPPAGGPPSYPVGDTGTADRYPADPADPYASGTEREAPGTGYGSGGVAR